jgi:hypothetical protein
MSETKRSNRKTLGWLALAAVAAAIALGRVLFGGDPIRQGCVAWNASPEQRSELHEGYSAMMGPCFAREAVAYIDAECSVPGNLKDWSAIAVDAGRVARAACPDQLPGDESEVFADGCEYWRETAHHWAKVEEMLTAKYGACYARAFRERGDELCARPGPYPPVEEFVKGLGQAGVEQCAH